MAREQLDLFAAGGRLRGAAREPREETALRPAEMDEGALIAILPTAGLRAAAALAAEAARRHLDAAVPALEKLCRKLTGFGAEREVPEQAAALAALQAIGGEKAKKAVARIIGDRTVQGPTLAIALEAAFRLGTLLPPARLKELLRDRSPSIRIAACRCVHRGTAVVEPLLELLDDLRPEVAAAAACALGRIGRSEARPLLIGLLRREPSTEVIDAMVAVADEEAIVTLGRIARTIPDLAESVREALQAIDHPRAFAAAAALDKVTMRPR